MNAKLVPKLVKKLKMEHDDIKEFILDTLHFCLLVNTDDALAHEGMEVFTELLSHQSASLRAKAARDIMDLRCVINTMFMLLSHITGNERSGGECASARLF